MFQYPSYVRTSIHRIFGMIFNYNMFIYLSSVIRYCIYIEYMNRNKTISISEENYNQLRKFGYAGQSLNQAIGKLLAIAAGGTHN